MREVLIAVAGFVAVCVAAWYLVLVWPCAQYAEVTGTPTKAVGLTCFLQTPDGKWMAWEEWKVRSIGNLPREGK